ncbi:MAG: retropepsin-like aspartic protease [Candidatus Omnitrophota bacterium]
MKKYYLFVSLLLILYFFGNAQADTVYLKNGRSVEGIIKTQTNDFIEIEISGGVVKFPKDEISWTVESSDGVKRQLREKWEHEKIDTERKIDKQDRLESLKPKHVEFMRDQQSMIIDVIINAKLNVKLILDTGASLVVLRKDLAKELGIDTSNLNSDMKIILADGREAKAKHIVLRSVRAGESQAENIDAAILIDDTKNSLLGDGVLGMSFLKHFNFKIDQKENKLILEKLP